LLSGTTAAIIVLYHLLMMRLGEEDPAAWFCRGSDGPRLASYQDYRWTRRIRCPVDWFLDLYLLGRAFFESREKPGTRA